MDPTFGAEYLQAEPQALRGALMPVQYCFNDPVFTGDAMTCVANILSGRIR